MAIATAVPSRLRAAFLPVLGLALLAFVVSQAWAGRPVTGASLLQLLVYALPIAGIYAISATGLVVVHSSTGIFNIAQGAIGMVCAFVYWELSVRQGLPVPVALVLVIVVFAPLLGLLLDGVLMRRLRRSTLITQLIGTVGITAMLLGVATLIWNPNDSYPLDGLGGDGGVRIAGILLSWHRIITIAVAVALAVVLRVLLTSTRLGLSMRAVVDDDDLASLHGIRPARVAGTAWVIGSVCAALAGILIAPEIGNMSAETLSLLIINAFAAAVFGRLRSLSLTYVGALLLGLAVAFSQTFLQLGGRWSPVTGVLPALALFVVLLLLPQQAIRLGRTVRTYKVEKVPTVGSALAGNGVLVALAVLGAISLTAVDVSRVITAVTLGVILLGLVPLLGWAGLPFFAPLAFAGFGAWATWQFGGGVPALLAAAGVTALVGVLVALPALRLSNLYLALASIAFALISVNLVFAQPEFFAEPRTLEAPQLLGVDLSRAPAFLVYAALVYAVLSLGVVLLRRSRFGRRVVAMRDSEAAAACLGINGVQMKALVFALAGAISGIGGGLLAQGQRFISVEQFPMIAGLAIILSLVVMGIGTASGPLVAGMLGAVLLALSKDWAPGDLTHALELFGPALAVLAMTGHPRGQIPVITERARQDPLGTAVRLGGFLTAVAVLYVLDVPGTIGLVLATVSLTVIALALGLVRIRQAPAPPAGSTPDDYRIGVDVPFTADRVKALDRELKLSRRA